MAVEQTWALQNASVNAITARQAYGSLLPPSGGILVNTGSSGAGELAVAQQVTPNMSVQVAAGRAWMPGNQVAVISAFDWSTQGPYFALNDAPVTVTIASADPVNPRIDAVYMATQDSFYSGANNQTLIGVVTGTPAASPSAPAVPVNAQLLALVNVAANATSIVTANITDKRTKIAPTVAGSAPLFIGRQTVAQSIGVGGAYTPITFDTADTDTASGWSSGSNTRYTVQVPGFYLASAAVPFGTTTNTHRIKLLKNGADVNGSNSVPVSGGATSAATDVVMPSVLVPCVLNDFLQVAVFQDSASALSTVVGAPRQPIFNALWVHA